MKEPAVAVFNSVTVESSESIGYQREVRPDQGSGGDSDGSKRRSETAAALRR